ncbi:MAG: hypothetical protein AAF512_12445 [Pseudomonadota bacterium]
MQCPQCSKSILAPAKLEFSLGAMGCKSCNGTLLSLVGYRIWREHHSHEVEESSDLEEMPEEPGKAISCTKCKRLMPRFRYTSDTRHVLDVCTYCEEVWLQEHEWEFLKHRELHGNLPHIFTDPWQKKRQTEQRKITLSDSWDKRLGGELHEEVAEIRTWLENHPQRDSILHYLSMKDPYDV